MPIPSALATHPGTEPAIAAAIIPAPQVKMPMLSGGTATTLPPL